MVHKDTTKISNTHGGALYYVVEVPLEEYEYEKYEKQRFRYLQIIIPTIRSIL